MKTKLFSRISARVLDYFLFYFTIIFTLKLFPYAIDERTWLFFLLFLPLLFIPVEAVFISLLGTTLGKYLFNIRVKDQKGQKLSLFKSLKRAFFEGWRNLFPLNLAHLICFFHNKGHSTLDQEQEIEIEAKPKKGFKFLLGASLLSLSFLTFFYEEEIKAKITQQEGLFSILDLSKDWKEFKGKSEFFTVLFPKEPKSQEKKLPVPGKEPLDYYEHLFEEGDITYSVSYTNLPQAWLKWSHSLVLKGAIKLIASNTPSTSIRQRRITNIGNKTALDFILQQKNKLTEGRLLINGTTLYKIEVSYPKNQGDELSENISYFIDSFQLKANKA